MGIEFGSEDVSGAAGVCQQMIDGDLGGDVVVGIVLRYVPRGAVSSTLPASTSWSIATAVNILFIDPIRKRVRRVFGIRLLRSASP